MSGSEIFNKQPDIATEAQCHYEGYILYMYKEIKLKNYILRSFAGPGFIFQIININHNSRLREFPISAAILKDQR